MARVKKDAQEAESKHKELTVKNWVKSAEFYKRRLTAWQSSLQELGSAHLEVTHVSPTSGGSLNECTVGPLRMSVVKGDLLKQRVDAIVNAANNELQHGGGALIANTFSSFAHVRATSTASCAPGQVVLPLLSQRRQERSWRMPLQRSSAGS